MAKEIDKIIQSKTAPKSNNVLWDDGENLKINRNGKWENSNGGAQSGDPNDAMPIYLDIDNLQTGKKTVAEALYRIQYMSQLLPIPNGKGPAFIHFCGTIMATRYNFDLVNGKRRLKLSYIIPSYSVDEDGEEFKGFASGVYAVDYSVDDNNYPIPSSVTVNRLANLSFDLPNQE